MDAHHGQGAVLHAPPDQEDDWYDPVPGPAPLNPQETCLLFFGGFSCITLQSAYLSLSFLCFLFPSVFCFLFSDDVIHAGMAIAVTKGHVKESYINLTFAERRMDVPRVPGLGLFLDCVIVTSFADTGHSPVPNRCFSTTTTRSTLHHTRYVC